MSNSTEFSVSIPIEMTINMDVIAKDCSSYEEILMSISDVDLKEATLHVEQGEILRAFIQAIALNNITIKKTP